MLKGYLDSSQGGFNTVLRRINAMIENTIRKVRGKLEMDRNTIPTIVVQMEEPLQTVFSLIADKVSRCCVDHLIAHVKHIYNPDGGFRAQCNDMWWNTSRGLPCPHQVLECINAGTPIMPSSIHAFWKKLLWEGIDEDESGEAECLPLHVDDVIWARIIRDYEEGRLDDDLRHEIVVKYIDYQEPGQSTLKEPQHVKPKGRPKKNVKVQGRDLTRLEHLQKQAHGQTCSSETLPPVLGTVVHLPHIAQHRNIHFGVDFGVGEVDEFMFPFMINAINVVGDGHCGYRSLACHLGWGQDDWMRVRREIVSELRSNYHMYAAVHPVCTPIEQLISNVGTMLSSCGEEFWMEMPMVGLAFATRFQCGVVCLSRSAPHTCLPMIGVPAPATPVCGRVITVALIQGATHFVPVRKLCEDNLVFVLNNFSFLQIW